MTAPGPQRKAKRPSLEIPKDLEPVYVNLVRIAHAPSEIIFEFAHIFPGNPVARVKTRLVMSPLSAKLFHRAMAENLAKYEANYGEITVPVDQSLAEYAKLFRPSGAPDDDGEDDDNE